MYLPEGDMEYLQKIKQEGKQKDIPIIGNSDSLNKLDLSLV
jgi:hypothetical protein